jgi:hypothetical protein
MPPCETQQRSIHQARGPIVVPQGKERDRNNCLINTLEERDDL